MEPFVSRSIVQLAPQLHRTSSRSPWICTACRVTAQLDSSTRRPRPFTSTTSRQWPRERRNALSRSDADAIPTNDLSHNVSSAEQSHFDRVEEESKKNQMRSPWMRDGSDKPPVARNRSASAMTKGKLLTTPSRMLKLILPLTTRDKNKDRKDVEPLALLVHPQQPLSYLERLIQSELPTIEEDGKERFPTVTFRAEDRTEQDLGSGKSVVEEIKDEDADKDADEEIVDRKREQRAKEKSAQEEDDTPRSAGKHEGRTSEMEDPKHANFVRWSPSTEIGDFIRDAARGKEFAVDIEGAPSSIYVGVPSFQDRTFYLRMRLRKVSKQILDLADIKRECDTLAQKGAQRVAQGGFVGMVTWWGVVYYLTFKTDLGWDVMEPVTYLVGLTGLMGGYMWFLYHNREASYRSAMNFTISRRQSKLYDQKGFNVHRWEGLVEEGNRLRREIQMVADEYDVSWDERKDAMDEKVVKALREDRKHGKTAQKERKKDEDDDEED